MIVIRYGAMSRTVTFTHNGAVASRNELTKREDDALIRLVKFLTFGDRNK
jgi:hypothetical protein